MANLILIFVAGIVVGVCVILYLVSEDPEDSIY